MTLDQNITSANSCGRCLNDRKCVIHEFTAADCILFDCRISGDLPDQISRDFADGFSINFSAESVKLLPGTNGLIHRDNQNFQCQCKITENNKLSVCQFLFIEYKICT